MVYRKEAAKSRRRPVESRVPGQRGRSSQDPADVVIRELIRSGRPATPSEVDRITRHLEQAPFPSARTHLAKRTQQDRQWVIGTTEQEYLDDLRGAIRDDKSRLAVYDRRGGPIAAVLTETERIVEPNRRGMDWMRWLLVVYSADRGIILSGYQASSMQTIILPKDVRWLK